MAAPEQIVIQIPDIEIQREHIQLKSTTSKKNETWLEWFKDGRSKPILVGLLCFLLLIIPFIIGIVNIDKLNSAGQSNSTTVTPATPALPTPFNPLLNANQSSDVQNLQETQTTSSSTFKQDLHDKKFKKGRSR